MTRRAALSLKARALGYIAQREHSRVELRRKLVAAVARQRPAAEGSAFRLDSACADPQPMSSSLEVSSALHPSAWPAERDIDLLLDWLAAHDLLSAERFVETRIHLRAARFGSLRIRQELSQHGLALDAAAVAELQASELTRARAVWAKRFGAPAADASGRAKQARFLAARGFGADVVRRVVSGLDDPG
jgi:regulatory protein